MLTKSRCEKCNGQLCLEQDSFNGEVDLKCLQCGQLSGSYVRDGADGHKTFIARGKLHPEYSPHHWSPRIDGVGV